MSSTLNICLFLGPYNSGCSSLATSISRILPGTIHVDGYLGLDPAIALNLGDHKNDFSMWGIVAALLQNPTHLLVSMTPAVLMDRKCEPNLIPYMKSVFGFETNFNIILIIPKIYATDEATLVLEGDEKQSFLDLESPHWEGLKAQYLTNAENPAEAKKRTTMFDILQKTVSSFPDFVRKVVFFPTDVEEMSEPHRQSVVQTVQSLAPSRIEGQPRFVQKRFLTSHGSEESKVHHITIDFLPGGVPFVPGLSDPLQAHVGSSVTGRLMTCVSTSLWNQLSALRSSATTILGDPSLHGLIPTQLPTHQVLDALEKMRSSIDLIMSDLCLLQDADVVKSLNTHLGKFRSILDTYKKASQANELTAIIGELETKRWLKFDLKGQIIPFIIFPGLFEGELGTRAHITVNYGPHKPADMRTAAQCVYSAAASIHIDACEYRYNTWRDIPVEILRLYYI